MGWTEYEPNIYAYDDTAPLAMIGYLCVPHKHENSLAEARIFMVGISVHYFG